MNTVKASISVGEASIQLEGPQEFVGKYLDQYQPLVLKWHELPTSRVKEAKASETKSKEAEAPKKTRGGKPKVGPSCGDRIRTLIDENYFTEPRTCSEVTKWLKDQKSITYGDNQVAASLSSIIKSGKLRRFTEAGKYNYTNP